MLTQAELKSILHYNPETGLFTWIKCNKYKPHLLNKIAGHLRSGKYKLIEIRIKNKAYLAHRLAWLYVHGYMPELIDHINGNPSDNRLCNIREASKQTNSLNTGKSISNTSGYKGVYFDTRKKKFIVECKVFKKKYYIGSFLDINLAIEAYKSFAIKHHGEFYRES